MCWGKHGVSGLSDSLEWPVCPRLTRLVSEPQLPWLKWQVVDCKVWGGCPAVRVAPSIVCSSGKNTGGVSEVPIFACESL